MSGRIGDPAAFEAALRAALGERGNEEPHPAAEILTAYHLHRLPADEADAVQEHLAGCDECSGLLLELVRFLADDTTAPAGVADFEEAAAWKRLGDRLAEEPEEATENATGEAADLARIPRPAAAGSHWLRAAAAVLLVTTLGLGGWAVSLSRRVAHLEAPQVNLPIVNLRPVGAERAGGEPNGKPVTVDTDGRFVVLLNPPTFPRQVDHRVEILDGAGRRVWSASDLRPSEAGTFQIALSRESLPAGDYRIRIGEGASAMEFQLRIAR